MDWQAVPQEPPLGPWSGRALAPLSGDTVGVSVVAITGGTATATSMRAAADGIAFPTDIAIELIQVCEFVCRREPAFANACVGLSDQLNAARRRDESAHVLTR